MPGSYGTRQQLSPGRREIACRCTVCVLEHIVVIRVRRQFLGLGFQAVAAAGGCGLGAIGGGAGLGRTVAAGAGGG